MRRRFGMGEALVLKAALLNPGCALIKRVAKETGIGPPQSRIECQQEAAKLRADGHDAVCAANTVKVFKDGERDSFAQVFPEATQRALLDGAERSCGLEGVHDLDGDGLADFPFDGKTPDPDVPLATCRTLANPALGDADDRYLVVYGRRSAQANDKVRAKASVNDADPVVLYHMGSRQAPGGDAAASRQAMIDCDFSPEAKDSFRDEDGRWNLDADDYPDDNDPCPPEAYCVPAASVQRDISSHCTTNPSLAPDTMCTDNSADALVVKNFRAAHRNMCNLRKKLY